MNWKRQRTLAILLLVPLVSLTASEPAWNVTLDENFDGNVVATDVKCPGSRPQEFILFTSESNVKSWNGERPKLGYGSKQTSTNIFEIDWVKAWERAPASAKTGVL